ncbi:MAG: choice-of-anchor B family protein [Bacteroidales bacterium]|jgi:choice-of-anchor B domain-containing protein|nr:choice-of-anchor B family protein [Bacteroidales bacterium]
MKKRLLFLPVFLLTIATFGQLNMSLVGQKSYNQNLSDVWGYVDETGIEYALVGVYNGLSVVSLEDPSNPEEVFFGSGSNSIWRDIKTWGDYAYVSNESGGGVYIVDLSPLPEGPITSTTNFTGDIYPFQTIHNLYIDEFGKLYIFGSNNGNGGAIICDLTQDPMNPVELGRYNTYYFHDGMVRGDTLWGSALYQGLLTPIDVSDPSNPILMGSVSTPSQFTHNAWVSDDGTHVFTTDEVTGGFIGAYNVVDPSNMYEVDRVKTSNGNNVIPHNVHVFNDYLVTSYYRDGIVVHDAKYPDRLFEVANFDTSPFSGDGFNGSWGAYPFLPSGLILASDIEEGLFVLEIDYQRAAYLSGAVRDISTNSPIFNAMVKVLETDLETQTNFAGGFEFGTLLSGTFDVLVSANGYSSDTIRDVELINGEITELIVQLDDFYVGIADQQEMESIKVFPNPFIDLITIEIPQSNENQLSITITNKLGQVIFNGKLNSENYSLRLDSNLDSGSYLISIYDGNQIVAKEVVIKQ